MSTTKSIKNLMMTMSMTIEQAMDALCIPAEERERYRKLAQQ
jgi:hypothetical protein